MKNQPIIVSLVLAALLIIASCKKNYTCSCTNSTVTSDNSGSIETKGETAVSYTKVTKKYAREQCSSGQDIATTGTGTNAVTVDRVWNCTLEGTAR